MSQVNLEYKNILDPSIIPKINSLELRARLVVEGFMVGLHKSPYHGFSVEFIQHRPYMQGDSLKNVDWKVYGRTEKFFIKQYEEETNLRSYILLDKSRSMLFSSENNVSKLDYAITLVAALSYLMMKQQDAVGLTLYSDKIDLYLPPKATRAYLQEILKNLSRVPGFDALDDKSKTLVILPKSVTSTIRAMRNIENVELMEARNLNTLATLQHKFLIIPKESAQVLEETFVR